MSMGGSRAVPWRLAEHTAVCTAERHAQALPVRPSCHMCRVRPIPVLCEPHCSTWPPHGCRPCADSSAVWRSLWGSSSPHGDAAANTPEDEATLALKRRTVDAETLLKQVRETIVAAMSLRLDGG